MSPIVGQAAPGGWDDEATTKVDNGARAARHRNLLRAAVMLHGHGLWSAAEADAWYRFTGSREVSARVLLAAIRASGISIDELR